MRSSSAHSQQRSHRGRLAVLLLTSVALVTACSGAGVEQVSASSPERPEVAKSREYLGQPAPRNDVATVALLLAGAVSAAVAQRAMYRLR